MRALAHALILISLAAPAAARDPVLTFPVECRIGVDCFLQAYVDHDPGPGALDYACGGLTVDGMGNTALALPDRQAMERGVPVRPVAPGRIAALRGGALDFTVPDLETAAGPADEAARRCGNAVVVDHGGGWESLYCHLRAGSIAVETGQRVSLSTELGEIGASGDTEYPQLAFWILKDGAAVDPFERTDLPNCETGPERPLWQEVPAYAPGGVIAAGFSGAAADYDAIKSGAAASDALPADAPVLLIWADLYGARTGDSLEFSIRGPEGEVLTETRTLETGDLRSIEAAGTGRSGDVWPPGRYSGEVRLIRDGREIGRASTSLRVGG